MTDFDLIVRGGFVVDGTGLPRRRVDVGVRDGKVARIANLDGRTAAEEIDATGCIVAPGIVDAHTHYDPQITFDPYATVSCFHGVTTVLGGNCGFSLAPCKPGDRTFLEGIFARVENMDPIAMSGDHVGPVRDLRRVPRPPGRQPRRELRLLHRPLRTCGRWVMGPDASSRAATAEEIADGPAARRGDGGRSRRRSVVVGRRPTSTSTTTRCRPRSPSATSCWRWPTCSAASNRARFAFLPRQLDRRLDDDDKALLIELGRAAAVR